MAGNFRLLVSGLGLLHPRLLVILGIVSRALILIVVAAGAHWGDRARGCMLGRLLRHHHRLDLGVAAHCGAVKRVVHRSALVVEQEVVLPVVARLLHLLRMLLREVVRRIVPVI